MTMPSKEDERTHQIDYENYMSLPDGAFNAGVLAAHAVETLAPYIANHSQKVAHAWKVGVVPIIIDQHQSRVPTPTSHGYRGRLGVGLGVGGGVDP